MTKLILVKGDSVKVLPTIARESIDLVFADYPFKFVGEEIHKLTGEKGRKAYERFLKFTSSEFYRVLKEGGNLVVINNPHNLFLHAKYLEKFIFRNEVTLVRRHTFYPNKMFGFKHNNAWFLCKGNKDKWNYVKLPDVMEYRTGFYSHPEALPYELVKLFIEVTTDRGDWVLDPFLGSGTTMKACLELGRNCIGIEINEEYVELVKRRLNWGGSLKGVEFEYMEVET